MGAERFFNIKCRSVGHGARRRGARRHGAGVEGALAASTDIVAGKPLPPDLLAENPDDVRAGAANLVKQIENVKVHGVSPVVAINAFPTDLDSEHQAIREIAESVGARVAVCTHFSDGGKGATDLAQAVVEACDEPSTFTFSTRTATSSEGEDRDRRHEDLRRRQRDLLAGGQQAAGALREATASVACRCASPRPTCRSAAMRR